MIYYKEKRFLNLLHYYHFKDLLEYNFWNDTEKKLFSLMYFERRSIKNIAINKLMPYERSRLFDFYKIGLSKLKKFLEQTSNPAFIELYKIK